ncbi:S13-like H2TH domain-containing protein [Schizopora paradoxa]|uniref:Small ribosomal subunit protein uS13m n=1 Tax=Schizopora paradoxa TaxID=27342 RepID=A0A0H2RIN9_9AGAM|nr:S13-like H2TH domain-containing protein [Schizopora paradoxa]
MVFILGVNLPDKKLARIALTAFYGIGHSSAQRICARLHIHDTQRVGTLSSQQITALASFLSSPSTAPALPRLPLASPSHISHFSSSASSSTQQTSETVPPSTTTEARPPKLNTKDPLLKLKIETELRREVRENIAHQRMIGSYVGRRHAMGMPVRGQNTQTNAKTARKLNRVDRRG